MGYINHDAATSVDRSEDISNGVIEFWSIVRANNVYSLNSSPALTKEEAEINLLWEVREVERKLPSLEIELVKSFDREESNQINTLLRNVDKEAVLIRVSIDMNDITYDISKYDVIKGVSGFARL